MPTLRLRLLSSIIHSISFISADRSFNVFQSNIVCSFIKGFIFCIYSPRDASVVCRAAQIKGSFLNMFGQCQHYSRITQRQWRIRFHITPSLAFLIFQLNRVRTALVMTITPCTAVWHINQSSILSYFYFDLIRIQVAISYFQEVTRQFDVQKSKAHLLKNRWNYLKSEIYDTSLYIWYTVLIQSVFTIHVTFRV